MEHLVEVLRAIVAEGHRRIGDLRLGGGDALLEGERIDEGLQGRAGGAERAGGVHPAPGAVATGRGDGGPHGAGARLDHQHGHGGRAALAHSRQGRIAFQPALQVGVYRRGDGGLGGGGGLGQFLGDREGRGGEGAAPGGRIVGGFLGGLRRHQVQPRQLAQHSGPGSQRRPIAPVRPPGFWGLGKGDEEGLLGVGERGGLVPEIGQGGGAHPLQRTAIGSEGQVGGEKLLLGVANLKLHGADGLDQLGPEGARLRVQPPGQLHGDGRGAGAKVAREETPPRRPQDRDRIDARVQVEPLVLHGEEPPNEHLIGVVEVRTQAPAAILHRQGPQPVAALVHHHGGGAHQLVERRREGGVHGAHEEQEAQAAERHQELRPLQGWAQPGEPARDPRPRADENARSPADLRAGRRHGLIGPGRCGSGPRRCGRGRWAGTCRAPRPQAGRSLPASLRGPRRPGRRACRR